MDVPTFSMFSVTGYKWSIFILHSLPVVKKYLLTIIYAYAMAAYVYETMLKKYSSS